MLVGKDKRKAMAKKAHKAEMEKRGIKTTDKDKNKNQISASPDGKEADKGSSK